MAHNTNPQLEALAALDILARKMQTDHNAYREFLDTLKYVSEQLGHDLWVDVIPAVREIEAEATGEPR